MATPQIKPIRVLLVDDQAVVRSGLRLLIESRPSLKVMGEAGNRADALNIASREQPDVIVLDLNLGNDNGLSLLPDLLGVAKDAHIIVLTGVADTKERDQSMELGAKGVVLKEDGAWELLNAIEKVYRTGDYWLEPGAAKRLFSKNTLRAVKQQINPELAKIATLTEREREVVALVGEGLKNKQIGSRLFIHHTTVSHHLTSIFDKLGVADRFELIIYAYRHGLAKPPV
jgi:two-component system nitrate/nitrite response regulator NarL